MLTLDTAKAMTFGQLRFLYEMHGRRTAELRLGTTIDLVSAIGCLTKEGAEGLTEHLARLRALASGEDPDLAGYTRLEDL